MWLTGLSVRQGLAYPATHTDHLSQEMSLQLHVIITKLARTVKWDNIPKPWITSLAVKGKEWTVQWPPPPISPMVLTAPRWRWVNHRTIKYWGTVYTTAIMNIWTNRQVPGHTHTHTPHTQCFGCRLCLGVVFSPLGTVVAQVPNGLEHRHLCSASCGSCSRSGSEKWLQYPSRHSRVCQR